MGVAEKTSNSLKNFSSKHVAKVVRDPFSEFFGLYHCLCGFLFITPAFTPQSLLSHHCISGDYRVECTRCVCSRECCGSCLKREDFTHQESRQERDHCSHLRTTANFSKPI